MSEQENKIYSVIDECHGIRVLFRRPNGTTFETRSEFLDELNALLARAEKAEADMESKKKTAEYWEARAVRFKFEADRSEGERVNRESLVWNADTALSAAGVKTHHTDAEGNQKPMTISERIMVLAKERDQLRRELFENRDKKLDLVKPSRFDWQRVRIDAAIAAMQEFLAKREPFDRDGERELACCSARCADLLVSELKKVVANE